MLWSCYNGGMLDPSDTQNASSVGTGSSYDVFGNMWAGGYQVALAGYDGSGNLILTPSVSSGVTKDQ